MKVRNRLVEIDIARGISIFLVVIFHAGGLQEGLLAEVFKSFRMPLFFIITGYLFSTSKYVNNLPTLFSDSFRSLLIPYFSFGSVSAAIWFLLQFMGNNKEILWFKPLLGLLYG